MGSEFLEGLDVKEAKVRKRLGDIQAARRADSKKLTTAPVQPPAPLPRQTQAVVSRHGPPRIIHELAEVEEAVAELGLNKSHMALWLGCSDDTVSRRLVDDPDFANSCERGLSRFRVKLSERIDRHADKYPIVALAQANQPHTLGWVTPNRQDRDNAPLKIQVTITTLTGPRAPAIRQEREAVDAEFSELPDDEDE